MSLAQTEELKDYLARTLDELEALRAKYKVALAALSPDVSVLSTTQLSVPRILKERKLPRPQRRSKG